MNELTRVHETIGYTSLSTSKRAIDILKLLINLLACKDEQVDYLIAHGIKELIIQLL